MNFTSIVYKTKSTGKTKLYVVGVSAETGELSLFGFSPSPKDGFETPEQAVKHAKDQVIEKIDENVGKELPYTVTPDFQVIEIRGKSKAFVIPEKKAKVKEPKTPKEAKAPKAKKEPKAKGIAEKAAGAKESRTVFVLGGKQLMKVPLVSPERVRELNGDKPLKQVSKPVAKPRDKGVVLRRRTATVDSKATV